MVEQTPPNKITRPRGLPVLTFFAILLALLLYWIIAHQVQGVNLQGWLPVGVERLISDYPLLDPLLPIIDFAVEMASPRVLIHLLAVFGGFYYARVFTIELVQKLYDLPNANQAQRLLTRLQIPPSPYTSWPLALDRRRFLEQRRNEPLLSIGGPGYVNISESDVAVTEINGRFERVLGYGRRTLRRFERIVAILDLRDQEATVSDIGLMTKEGLPLKTDIHIQFRIKRRESTRGDRIGYTFDEESVRKAAYYQVVTKHGVNRWTSLPPKIAIGQLSAIVGQKRLDEMLDPNKVYDLAPQPDIQQTLKVRVQQILSSLGLELVDIRYTSLRLSDEMHTVMVDYWKGFQKRPTPLSPSPQGEDGTFAALAKKRARDKMIASLASGISTVRERKLAQEGRPQTNQLPMQQMLQLVQAVVGQQQQIAAPASPPPKYLLSLERNKINNLVWQLLGEFEGALRISSPLTSESLYTLLESPRLKLRMRDAVTSFATLSTGSTNRSDSYALQKAGPLSSQAYDTLVIEQKELAALSQELIREATRSTAEEVNRPETEVAQWIDQGLLSDRFINTSAQHFLPAPEASAEQMQDLMQTVLGGSDSGAGAKLLTLSRGKVNHLVEQLVRELEAVVNSSATLVRLGLGALGRSTRLRLRMRETVTFQANPSATGTDAKTTPSFDTLVVEEGELEILSRQLVWETSITAGEELTLSETQSAFIVQSADLFDRYKNALARYFTPLPNETTQQMQQHLQLALKQKQVRAADRHLFLQRGRVNDLVWQLIHDFESILRNESLLAAEASESVGTPSLQLFMREAVTIQAKPAVGAALELTNYSFAASQKMDTVHRLPKYDTLVVQQAEVDTLTQQLIKGATVTAGEALNLSADTVAELAESAELNDRFKTTITQYFVPPPDDDDSNGRHIASQSSL
ncbi:MAG: SPFH domain-containing protein [Candidatus Promineifilaceae bacterium]